MSALLDALVARRRSFCETWTARLPADQAALLSSEWRWWALPGQLPPDEPWETWLMMAGRGFGKTRSGAEWIQSVAEHDGAARVALVGGTAREVREIMVEGDSGIMTIAPEHCRPSWEPSRGRLLWPNGAQAAVFSGENPESLRGPQHSHAWCDELAKWSYPQATWDNLRLGLRKGKRPQVMVTTTPRAIPLIRALVGSETVKVTGGRTRDNGYLSRAFIEYVEHHYATSCFGRQELEGALIEDIEGALWTRAQIEKYRVRVLPPLARVVIGVDPPAGVGGDACGIVVVGQAADGRAYVIDDASVEGLKPEGWAMAVAKAAARHGADRVVAEANQGGSMVESVLRAASLNLPLKLVHASKGKSARAEPVSALYEAGRVFHAASFPRLEDELCGFIAGGG